MVSQWHRCRRRHRGCWTIYSSEGAIFSLLADVPSSVSAALSCRIERCHRRERRSCARLPAAGRHATAVARRQHVRHVLVQKRALIQNPSSIRSPAVAAAAKVAHAAAAAARAAQEHSVGQVEVAEVSPSTSLHVSQTAASSPEHPALPGPEPPAPHHCSCAEPAEPLPQLRLPRPFRPLARVAVQLDACQSVRSDIGDRSGFSSAADSAASV